MFDHRHYVPVLRWKRGEQYALRHLSDDVHEVTWPLIEVSPRRLASWRNKAKTLNGLSQKLAETITDSRGRRRVLLDYTLLHNEWSDTDRAALLDHTYAEGQRLGLRIIPVVTERDGNTFRQTVRRIARGKGNVIGLRIDRRMCEDPHLAQRLRELVTSLGTVPGRVHLLVDRGIVDNHAAPVATLLKRIPALKAWLTLTTIGGSFPKDLSGYSVGEHLQPRLEWTSWRYEIMNGWPFERIPTFGDYTTQHPVFSEPPRQANFSASIRYTTPDGWVIMRGEGVFNDDGPGFAQWPANAQMLLRRREYEGRDYSVGDRYIQDMASQTATTGNAETWLRAGINHHITLVVRQLTSLFA